MGHNGAPETQTKEFMSHGNLIEEQYAHSSLLSSIERGVHSLGKSKKTVTIEDLAKVDEFHIGGKIATEAFLDQLNISSGYQVLDIGSGLGGGSRFAARRYGCEVIGVDLTQDYVETGNVLSSWFGLEKKVRLKKGNATNLTFSENTFDRAFMLHVGMNISEKRTLASEIYRVLKPGGIFGIYDVMKVGDGELTFPVPWATQAKASSVSTRDHYREALQHAGFKIIAERNRRDFAIEFFLQLRSNANQEDGPPPLGLHLLMGDTAQIKVANMIENISNNIVAPIEMIAKIPNT